jgi:hypothetical protein
VFAPGLFSRLLSESPHKYMYNGSEVVAVELASR